jgi:hypothetical protein
MSNKLQKQYANVNSLRTQKATIEGDDPYRNMTGEELRELILVSDKLTKAVKTMKDLEKKADASRNHPSGQADF